MSMDNETKTGVINHVLGFMGRMLSGSKSAYSAAHPGHTVFFNGNIYDATGQKLWYGDIDLTRDADKLQAIASELKETLYVTRESPFRFDAGLTLAKIQAACQGPHPSAVAIDP